MEFANGALEARCEYCAEVLIRELAPAEAPRAAPAPLPQQRYVAPSPVYQTARTKVWPFVIVSGATVAIAGASGVASFATQLRPLPEPATEARATIAAVPEVRVERDSVTMQAFPSTLESPASSKASDAGAPRSPRTPRAKTTAAVALPPEPPKPPKFDTQAAIAGLDAAKAKAEAACKSSSSVSFFVQMGFDPDGKNRGAALSNPKFAGTPEAKCALKIFRAVRIPAFDPATKPGGLGRMVKL